MTAEKKQKSVRDWLHSLLPVGLLVVGICGFGAIQSTRKPPEQRPAASQVPLVETTLVERNPEGMELKLDGLVAPYREISLAAEVPGRIATKTDACQAGEYVTKGTLLLEIDPRDYELEVTRLELELKQTQVNLQELDVEQNNVEEVLALLNEDLALQQRQLERIAKIFQKSAASESTYDEARRAELTARSNRQTQQNQLQMVRTRRARLEQAEQLAESKLAKARLDLTRTKIVAPLDGVVIKEFVEQDSYVQPGTQLVTIDDTSAAEVECNLKIEELRWIWEQAPAEQSAGEHTVAKRYQMPRLPVTVTYQIADHRYGWSGVLSHYDGIGLDERTRTVPCRIRVENPRGAFLLADKDKPAPGAPALMRGMFVQVGLQLESEQPLLRVPERAIRPGNVAWVYAAGKLQIKPVKVAQLVNDVALIEPHPEGLQQQDRVIVSPLAAAAEGMAVEEKATP